MSKKVAVCSINSVGGGVYILLGLSKVVLDEVDSVNRLDFEVELGKTITKEVIDALITFKKNNKK